jgi:hypothetical protein
MRAKRVIKRLLWSLLGGILIPFCYSITMGPLSSYIESYSLQTLLYAPIGWPKLLLYRLFPLGSFPFTSDTSLLVYIVSCNILFYGLVTYCFLTIRARRRIDTTEAPPPPPLGTTH